MLQLYWVKGLKCAQWIFLFPSCPLSTIKISSEDLEDLPEQIWGRCRRRRVKVLLSHWNPAGATLDKTLVFHFIGCIQCRVCWVLGTQWNFPFLSSPCAPSKSAPGGPPTLGADFEGAQERKGKFCCMWKSVVLTEQQCWTWPHV